MASNNTTCRLVHLITSVPVRLKGAQVLANDRLRLGLFIGERQHTREELPDRRTRSRVPAKRQLHLEITPERASSLGKWGQKVIRAPI